MVAPPPWILDISRLLATARRGRPSGMERVELAYARHVLGRPGGAFAAVDRLGRFGLLPNADVAALLAGGAACLPRAVQPAPQPLLELAGQPGAVFSIVAHHGLQRGPAIAALRRRGARFVPAVHDIIPLQHPDTTRWLQRLLTWARMRELGRQADGVLVFSQATRTALQGWLAGRGVPPPPMMVAGLGLDLPVPAEATPAAPYFLCIATVEKRKNHALLLDAWQAMGPAAPRLVLVGRRSFGAGQALARLDAGMFRGVIEERGHCPDAELAALLAGARALVLPTIAEGFGIPVAEALAAGVPVLCSDLPVLRELGGDVPEYLPPHDASAWAAMVQAYAAPESPARAAQLARLAGWQPGDWGQHFIAVENFLHTIARSPARP